MEKKYGGIAGRILNQQTSKGPIIVDSCNIIGTTEKSNKIGGIGGNTADWVKLENMAVKNSKIQSYGSQVGGIIGLYNFGGQIQYNYVQDTTIEGYSKVGGIIGETMQGNFIYNYVDAEITATEHTVGGIIGYLENTNMAANYSTSYIYLNYIANSTIKAPEKAGGIIGDTSVPLYYQSGRNYYYRNLVEAQIICDEKETASLGIGGRKEDNYKMSQIYIYEYSTINGEFINEQNDTFTSSQYASLENLKTPSFYTGKLGWGTQFNYNVLSQNKYPILNRSDVPEQTGIDLPTEPGGQGITTNSELPQITAYSIGANKLNLDLSSVEEGTSLTYETENTESNTIDVDKRTYTFAYNYQVPITLSLKNGEQEETIKIEPEEVKNEVSNSKGITAYLKDENLIVEGETLEEKFVNVQKGQALGKNSKIYNIEENTWEEETVPELELIEIESKEGGEYKGKKIETYGTYSTVDGKEVNAILEVNYNTLTATDGKLEKVQAEKIIDSYNEKEYETILGTDGKLYDLKTAITYPENFKNEEIKTIAVNNEEKEAIVYYENENVVEFNYMTGDIVYEDKKKEEMSIWEYMQGQWNEEKTSKQEGYEKAKQIENKLKEEPISVNLGKNADYVTMYNSETGEYEIYAEEELLTKEEIKSEKEKIEEQGEEVKKYYETAEGEKEEKNNGFYLILASILGVCITLIILRHIVVKRKRK